jgi:hypothetical protein
LEAQKKQIFTCDIPEWDCRNAERSAELLSDPQNFEKIAGPMQSRGERRALAALRERSALL